MLVYPSAIVVSSAHLRHLARCLAAHAARSVPDGVASSRAGGFADGYDPPRPLTPAQRDPLQTFVDTDEATGSIAGNWLWFRAAGLPQNRQGIAALLRSCPPPHRASTTLPTRG